MFVMLLVMQGEFGKLQKFTSTGASEEAFVLLIIELDTTIDIWSTVLNFTVGTNVYFSWFF